MLPCLATSGNIVAETKFASQEAKMFLNKFRNIFVAETMFSETTASRQLQKVQNKTNSENGHLVFSIFKKKQENNGVGDILSLFQRHCQSNWFDNVFGIKTKYHRLRCFLVVS